MKKLDCRLLVNQNPKIRFTRQQKRLESSKKIFLNSMIVKLVILVLITGKIKCDCGFIKLRDSMKEFDGENAQIISGSFEGFFKTEYSVFGFFRVLGKEVKTYNIFKFDNNPSDRSGIRDSEIPGVYSELLTVSFTRYSTENLLLCKSFILLYN